MAGGEDDPDFHSYSLRPYEQEFLEHPDLVATWAVDEAFLARFAQGFEAYRRGALPLHYALYYCNLRSGLDADCFRINTSALAFLTMSSIATYSSCAAWMCTAAAARPCR